ncbi:MAG TPA: hypothetical protein VLT32_20720, partial [Candidatus Sulfomarinibacteraceae bacterium]|nr:hypothetical protein [Candidatus Sulfomarinibacteraceae bacterium]
MTAPSRAERVFTSVHRPAAWLAVALVLAATVAVLHGPSRSLTLTGDSYQWIQHAHAACHRPVLLLVDLDTFLRPSTTWTLTLDRIVWGGFEASGFRTTSLALHFLAALALAAAGRRLGLGLPAAAAVALVWATSPFTDESVFVVAYRFQPLLLLAWLVLITVWPGPDEGWPRWRIGLATLAVVAAAAAKETWVVTPALVFALELDRRLAVRRALRPAVLVAAAVAAYVALYFLAFPSGKTYYVLGDHVLARIPSQLAAFLYLDEPMPFELSLTWVSVLATAAVALAAVVSLRWRVRGTWTALALMLLPTLPTLLVPYMPQRYLAIPYAGFLLLVALWVNAAAERRPQWRAWVRAVAVLAAALVIAAGVALVRADLVDYRALAAAHSRVLAEARTVAGTVAAGVPTVVVRDERLHPLLEIMSDPVGLPKLAYTRHDDPAGLIDAAALFEWVLAE